MPELPEVETMVRGLRPALEGRRIRDVTVHDPSMLVGATAEELAGHLKGATVQSVARRGKWVVLHLAGGGIIVIQPRMTGGFWLVPPQRLDHVRLTLHLGGDGECVWFRDTRRLGKIAWHPGAAEAEAAFRASQGPDALEIGLDELSKRFSGVRRGIKPTLMDQKILAGIGNIYADETLFRARIHPERPAGSLNRAEQARIHSAVGEVLGEAIAAEGSSFDGEYRTVLGLEGGFLAQNAMYGRVGQPCPGCGRPIVKAKIAGLVGRPTYYCPHCQPARPRRRKANS